MLNPDKIKTETEIRLRDAEARVADLEQTTDEQAAQNAALVTLCSRQGVVLRKMAIALQAAALQRAARKIDFWKDDADYSARNMGGKFE